MRSALGAGAVAAGLFASAGMAPAQPPTKPSTPAAAEGDSREALPAPVPKPRSVKKKPPEKSQVIAGGVSFAEMEAAIVKGTGLYVVLDPARSVLEVRSRGLVLDSVPLSGIEFLNHSPIFGGDEGAVPALPATWTLAEDAGDFEREIIAPNALRPYVPEDKRTALDEARNPKVIAAHDEHELPPSTYEVKLTNGWALEILDQAPQTGFFSRYAAAVKEGLGRLRGEKRQHPPMLAIAMKGEDARRIHHVFRAELPVLIAPGKA